MQKRLFSELELSEPVLKAVERLGFELTSPIQSAAIPLLLAGKDVVGQSATGSGKTAAFAIPAIEKISDASRHTAVLIMTPTRELAQQVAEEFSRLSFFRRGIYVTAIFGGASYDQQFRELRKGPQVVIGTPGRIIDHLQRNTLDLSHVSMVVLDECDRMLDMGFREDMERILSAVPKDRQTVFFSATLPPAIKRLINDFSKDPEHVHIAPQELSVPTIEQMYFEVQARDKLNALTTLLQVERPRLSIIFCNTQAAVDDIADALAERGFSSDRLHGGLSQMMRTRTMSRFKQGVFQYLVATDVAGRGIDVDDLDLVINFDLPYDPEDYVHRIGRTGRAGRSGRAISLVSMREGGRMREISRFTKMQMRRCKVPTLSEVEEIRIGEVVTRLKLSIAEDKHVDCHALAAQLLDGEDAIPAKELTAALLHEIFGQLGITPPKEAAAKSAVTRAAKKAAEKIITDAAAGKASTEKAASEMAAATKAAAVRATGTAAAKVPAAEKPAAPASEKPAPAAEAPKKSKPPVQEVKLTAMPVVPVSADDEEELPGRLSAPAPAPAAKAPAAAKPAALAPEPAAVKAVAPLEPEVKVMPEAPVVKAVVAEPEVKAIAAEPAAPVVKPAPAAPVIEAPAAEEAAPVIAPVKQKPVEKAPAAVIAPEAKAEKTDAEPARKSKAEIHEAARAERAKAEALNPTPVAAPAPAAPVEKAAKPAKAEKVEKFEKPEKPAKPRAEVIKPEPPSRESEPDDDDDLSDEEYFGMGDDDEDDQSESGEGEEAAGDRISLPAPARGFRWLSFNAGKDHGLKPRDIVDAITEGGEYPGNCVGLIRLHTRESFVQVTAGVAKDIADSLHGGEFEGRKLKVKLMHTTMARGESDRPNTGNRTGGRNFDGSSRKPRATVAPRKTYGARTNFDGPSKSFDSRPPATGERKPYGRSFDGPPGGRSFDGPPTERKSYSKSFDGPPADRKPYGKSYGDSSPPARKPYGRSADGPPERRSFDGPPARKPYGKSFDGPPERRSFDGPPAARKSYGDGPPAPRKTFGKSYGDGPPSNPSPRPGPGSFYAKPGNRKPRGKY